jgi:hypothetical protein
MTDLGSNLRKLSSQIYALSQGLLPLSNNVHFVQVEVFNPEGNSLT